MVKQVWKPLLRAYKRWNKFYMKAVNFQKDKMSLPFKVLRRFVVDFCLIPEDELATLHSIVGEEQNIWFRVGCFNDCKFVIWKSLQDSFSLYEELKRTPKS